MDLPVSPPVKPMLAKAIEGIPVDGDLIFEPKYDGFRCIVFRDGDEVVLGSRNERPLTRYFPEMLVAMRDHLPDRCVVDQIVDAMSRDGYRSSGLVLGIVKSDPFLKRSGKGGGS